MHENRTHGEATIWVVEHLDYFQACQLLKKISPLANCRLCDPDRVFTPSLPDSVFEDVNCPVKWAVDVQKRRRRYHKTIVDMALCLTQLPPYVLLEIVDWLPHIYLYPHQYKIALLTSVRASIWKLRPPTE